jgi:cellulose synthase (UDP-forming)
LPYYLVYFTAYTWLNRKTQSFLIGDIYTSIHCIPLSLNLFKVLLNPFSEGFKVTPKGVSRNASVFHWDLASPLIGLLIINLISFGGTIYQLSVNQNQLAGIGIIWSAYNLLLIGCILASLLDAPKVSIEWFKLSKPIAIKLLKTDFLPLSGTTTKISEFGIKVTLNQKIANLSLPTPLVVEFKDDAFGALRQQIDFSGEIVSVSTEAEFPQLEIKFKNLSLNQQRYLVETLFCTPSQWQRRETPGDLQILWLLLKNAATKNKFRS